MVSWFFREGIPILIVELHFKDDVKTAEIFMLKPIRFYPIVDNFVLISSFFFFFLFLVKKSQFRRTADAVKSAGPHDGTRNRRASSKIHCKKTTHSGCDGCEEKKAAKLLSLIFFLFV